MFTEPPIITGITAAAVSSSVITLSNWAAQSSGACTIHYDVCICLASSSCSPSGLATSSDGARECKSNLAEGVWLLSFNNHYMSIFLDSIQIPCYSLHVFCPFFKSLTCFSLVSNRIPRTSFSFAQKPSRASRTRPTRAKLALGHSLQLSKRSRRMTVSLSHSHQNTSYFGTLHYVMKFIQLLKSLLMRQFANVTFHIQVSLLLVY